MTHTLSGSRTRPAPARSPGDAAGRILRAVAILACLPYIGLMVAFRAGRPVRLALPLSLACVGSAALACWGGWLLLTGLTAQNAAKEPTALMNLTYAVQMTVGLLVLTAGGRFFRERGFAGGAAAYRAS
ncbi:hypothetical protein AB0L49_15375 [Streptomyces antimycoticus]|uniref:hypothetical protein n=1 Tax=Streptomyces antimycoticus TaxID=68175 RepID=UPI0034272C51